MAEQDADPTRALLDFATHFSPGAEAADQAHCFDNANSEDQPLHLAGATLRGASLQHARLPGSDLSQADLTDAACGGIVLDDSRLEQTIFRNADLAGASLQRTDAGQACFEDALLEDVRLVDARLRFADFTRAVMDGGDLSGADLWGAQLGKIVAHRANFRNAKLDEVKLAGADLAGADLTAATLRRADLTGAILRGAVLRECIFAGANLSGVDFSEAILPHVVLTGCDLRGAKFAGAWLERTRMCARQIGKSTGEEQAGQYEAAVESYIVLEQNFRSLGNALDASWAFRRRRRMGKQLHRARARSGLTEGNLQASLLSFLLWASDVAAEALCDYGESLTRILRALAVVLVGCALTYWLTGSLVAREPALHPHVSAIDYLLFSLDSMTSVGTGEVYLRAAGQLGILISSLQTVAGTVLLGLFGFVLGVRVRN